MIDLMNKNKEKHEVGWWKKDAKVSDLIKTGIKNGFNTFVAVGGDGTINQVAKELVNTDLILGIIPFGSGNGFARHLKINGNIDKQMNLLLNGRVKTIDTGLCNGKFFVNIAGVGFDAHVSHKFANSESRGMINYARVSLQEAHSYAEEAYEMTIDGVKSIEKAFLISIANGSQWGNEFYIAPKAVLNDGRLRCCFLNKPNIFQIPGLVRKFLRGEIDDSKYYKDIPFKHLIIKRTAPAAVHLDGEPFWMDETVEFKVNASSLKVICHD